MLAYVNAKSKILKYIRDSGLEAGDRLPTEVELSERLGIGRLSLREGLNALKSEGIVVAMQGRGTFVACSSTQISDTLNLNYSVTEMIRCSGHEPDIAYFKKEIVPADKVVAAALKCGQCSGREHDKAAEFGIVLTDAQHVSVQRVRDSRLVLECRLVQQIEVADHVLYIAEVAGAYGDPDAKGLYAMDGYHRLNTVAESAE